MTPKTILSQLKIINKKLDKIYEKQKEILSEEKNHKKQKEILPEKKHFQKRQKEILDIFPTAKQIFKEKGEKYP